MAQSMENSADFEQIITLEKDKELYKFIDGQIDEPEARVGRRGVPDNSTRYREPRTGSSIWQKNKEEVLKLGRIRLMVGKFDYTVLPLSNDIPQIRLLRIRPARKPLDDLLCELCVMNLADVQDKFEALSYCWGVGDPDETITIQSLTRIAGTSDTATRWRLGRSEVFPVRSNLFWALRALRRQDRPILLWVDAICINQRSTAGATREKNKQLSMMSDIYNSAKNVCIWLGRPDDKDKTNRSEDKNKTKAAFDFVKTIANFQMLERRLHRNDEDYESIADQWCGLVKTLKKSQWFSRRWIIQEIASARNASVHYGDDAVHWDDLAVAISLLSENCSSLERVFRRPLLAEIPTLSATKLVKALSKVCRKTPKGEIYERLLDFETLVCTFQHFQASFPKDIIHSVRALAKDAPAPEDANLGLDNETSTRDLFIAFVKRCIKHSGSLDIICRHLAPPVVDAVGHEVQLPTWISGLSEGPFGLPGKSSKRQHGENIVAITPGYKWKRYNASNSWLPPKKSEIVRPQGNLTLHVPPHDGNNVAHRWSTGNTGGASYTQLFTESPTLRGNPVSTGYDDTRSGAEQEQATESHLLDLQESKSGSLSTGETRNGTSTNTNSLTGHVTQSMSSKFNGVSRDPMATKVVVQEYPGKRYSKGHKRASTLPTLHTVPETIESKVDNWKVVMNASLRPKKLDRQIREQIDKETHPESNPQGSSQSRQSSNAKQEDLGDPEHLRTFPGQLEVYGFRLGDITECSDLMREGIVPGDWLKKLGWQDDHQNSVPEEIWRLLVADRTADGSDPPEWYRRACLHCLKDTRLTHSKGDLHSHENIPDNKPDTMTSTYLKRVESVVWRRRIIKLELNQSHKPHKKSPLFGLVPEKTAVGDIVCIIAGCSVPVVLHPVPLYKVPNSDYQEEVFELVGEAYIHTMMDGEAVPNEEFANKLGKTFTLQ